MKVMFPYFAAWKKPYQWAFYAELKDAKAYIEKHGFGYVQIGKHYHVYENGSWSVKTKPPELEVSE